SSRRSPWRPRPSSGSRSGGAKTRPPGTEAETPSLGGTPGALAAVLLLVVLALSALPQDLLRTVGADDACLLPIGPPGDGQRAAGAVALLDTLAHAAVDQEQQAVSLEQGLLAAVLAVRKRHPAILMALDHVFDTQLARVVEQHGFRIGAGLS